jgi:hypothetical protein
MKPELLLLWIIAIEISVMLGIKIGEMINPKK